MNQNVSRPEVWSLKSTLENKNTVFRSCVQKRVDVITLVDIARCYRLASKIDRKRFDHNFIIHALSRNCHIISKRVYFNT